MENKAVPLRTNLLLRVLVTYEERKILSRVSMELTLPWHAENKNVSGFWIRRTVNNKNLARNF